MTPPRKEAGGNSPRGQSFDSSSALVDLERRMENGEQDIRELRYSHDALKKQVVDDRVALAKTLGEIQGGIRMLLVIGSVSGALVMIGLGILGLVLRK